MGIKYIVHSVEWTNEKLTRFWDWHNTKDYQDNWFTKQVGDGLINFVTKHVKIEGDILDYGSGKAHFTNLLLQFKRANISSSDFSEKAVNYAQAAFKSKKNFKGAYLLKTLPSDIKKESFNIVFLLETIEHLTENYLNATLREINRILQKNGKLIITTPSNENLIANYVHCPDCGAVFHRMQHMRSFSETKLAKLVDSYNFSKILCHSLHLGVYKNKNLIKRCIVTNLFPQKPNLIYIGKKNNSSY